MEAIKRHLLSRWRDNALLRHSVILLVASQVANVANILFQILMMRGLSGDEYALLAACFSVFLVIYTPMEALRTVVSHEAARLRQAGAGASAVRTFRQWLIRVAGPAVIALAGTVWLAPAIAQFFHATDAAAVRWLGVAIATGLLYPVYIGIFQGLETFGWLSAAMQLWALSRLALGVALVFGVSATARYALGAQAGSMLITLAIGSCGMARVLRAQPRALAEAPPSDVAAPRDFFPALAGLAAYATLMNLDAALVKHFLPAAAGDYAKVSTLARALVFLPMPIALAMFPKVVGGEAEDREHHRTLGQAMVYVLGLQLAAALVFSLLAGWIWRLFTGAAALDHQLLVTRCAFWAYAPLGLVFLLLNFQLARRRFFAGYGLVVVAAAYVAGIQLWHDTLLHIVQCVAVASLAGALWLLAGLRLPAAASPKVLP